MDSATPGTTVMFRQIPRKLAAWDMVAELERFMPRTTFDFVYIPWVSEATHNMGYAFVNFRDEAFARAACSVMREEPWLGMACRRPMDPQPAHTQGLDANLRRFQQSSAYRAGDIISHAPLVFEDGKQLPWRSAVERCLTDGADQQPKGGMKEFQVEVITGVDFFESNDSDLGIDERAWSAAGFSLDSQAWSLFEGEGPESSSSEASRAMFSNGSTSCGSTCVQPPNSVGPAAQREKFRCAP